MSGMRGSDLRWLLDLLFGAHDRRISRLLPPLREARRLCDQAKTDLDSAHSEICRLQGLDPNAHSWPDWTPQANTLRWIDSLLIPELDKALAKAGEWGPA